MKVGDREAAMPVQAAEDLKNSALNSSLTYCHRFHKIPVATKKAPTPRGRGGHNNLAGLFCEVAYRIFEFCRTGFIQH